MGGTCFLEAPYLHDICTQHQHNPEAASSDLVSLSKFSSCQIDLSTYPFDTLTASMSV